MPIVMAAAFDPDGWKRVSQRDGEPRPASMCACIPGSRRPSSRTAASAGVICETKAGRQAILGKVVDRRHRRPRRRRLAGAPFTTAPTSITTVFRLGGVDTDDRRALPLRGAGGLRQSSTSEAKRIVGGSWDRWWLKTPLPGIVWCNCPHMAGYDALKVEDLTRADFEGRERIYALVDYARANMPGFRQLLRRRCRAAARRAPDAAARGRIHRDQGGRERTRHFADTVARGRDYYTPYRSMLPQGHRRPAGRRPPLFLDRIGPEADRARFRPAWRWARRPAWPRRSRSTRG
jgi:hypothetical protein